LKSFKFDQIYTAKITLKEEILLNIPNY